MVNKYCVASSICGWIVALGSLHTPGTSTEQAASRVAKLTSRVAGVDICSKGDREAGFARLLQLLALSSNHNFKAGG